MVEIFGNLKHLQFLPLRSWINHKEKQKMVELRHGENTLMFLNDRHRRVPIPHFGIYAKSGYGKSLCEEGIASTYHDEGFCVIYLGDGMKGEEEGAYAQFPVEATYHLRLLKKFGITPKTVPVKLYHPFSFSIPTTLLPDYNFFTIPIKSLGRSEFSMLSETKQDSDTIRILMQSSQNLGKESGIYQLLHDIQELIKGKRLKDSVKPSLVNFFLSVTAGTSKSMQDISNLFQPFKRDYFLSKLTCPLNLDFKKILADKESIHFFSTRYLRDPKMKEFVILAILNKIIEHKSYARSPVMIVIPEIRKLCPDRAVGYQQFLSEAIKESLSTMRSIGKGIGSILTSQSWSDTSQPIRDSHNVTLLGELSLSDIDKISKIRNYSKDIRQSLAKPDQDYSWLWVGREDMDGFCFFPAPYCHAEPEMRFDEMFRKHYLNRMKRFGDTIELMKSQFTEEEDKIRQKVKRGEEREKQRLEQKRKEREQRQSSEPQDLKKKERELKEQAKLKDMERAYYMKQEGLTLIDIAGKLGVSKDSIRRWLLKYEKIMLSKQSEKAPESKE